jgi:Flp pilus assembly CpaE family ATPase
LAWGADLITASKTGALLDAEEAQALLALLRRQYELVIVDCPGRLKIPGYLRGFLAEADRTLLVGTPDSASVAALRRLTADRGLRIKDPFLVVNRDRPRALVQPSEIARETGLALGHVLPEDPLVDKMFAERTPLPLFSRGRKRKSPFLAALKNLPIFEEG